MYTKIKRQNGEAFAQTLRRHHDGLLAIDSLAFLVRHAGRDSAPLLPYLMSLIMASEEPSFPTAAADPFELLAEAGYDAFYADTLDAQNSIEPYFAQGEGLCTFKDSSRFQGYHIVHAVRQGAGNLNRKDFRGIEKRQDIYGTSVISIQILKDGGFIKITNRYNHTVAACDSTFDSNPDQIIDGLSAALKEYFRVDFSAPTSPLPTGFIMINGQIFHYHKEQNNIYYGDQTWATHGVIHAVDRGTGDALFDQFLFNNKTKMLEAIDSRELNRFYRDFNRDYGGRSGLHIKDGNLMLGRQVLIGAQASRITTLDLPDLTSMRRYSLSEARHLTHFTATSLRKIGRGNFRDAPALTHVTAPALTHIGKNCFRNIPVTMRLSAHNHLQVPGHLTPAAKAVRAGCTIMPVPRRA